MSEEDLVLRISGDSSGGQAAVQGQADAVDKATKSVDGHTEALRRVTEATQEHVDLLPTFISKYIEARTIYDLAKTAYEDYVELIRGSVEAYGEAEQAEVRLSAALKNTGAEEAADSYGHFAEELSSATIVSKTAGLEAAGTFTLIGQVGPENMKAAMQAAADFSAGTGRSMESATLAIAKASDGNIGQLKRFGVEIDAERAKTEGIGYIIDAVSQKFGGQAEALSGTLLGSWKQMGNQWELAEEQLGAKLAPAVITLGHALGAVIGIVAASPDAFLTLVAASTVLAGSMAWMAATSVYGAQFSRLATIIGGELTANVSVFNGVALTTEGSVLGLAAAETTVAETSVLASGSILGLSEAAGVAAPAVAATATSVGLLGVALPVVVVAMAAWMIGKWLGDITGMTDAIQHWAGASGDAALAAETAGAKQDVINRALELGAPTTISYGDAVKYVNDQFSHTREVLPDATKLLADWQKKIDDAYNKAQQMKLLVDAIRDQPGFVEGSSFDFAGDEERAKKAAEAAQQFQKVLLDVASAGQHWQDTLQQMDGGVVAWSLHLLDMGVSLDTVRKYYGLTEAQGKALEDQQKFLASTVDYSTNSFIAHAGGVGLVSGGYVEADRALTGLNDDGTLAAYVLDDITGKFTDLGPTIYSATDALKGFREEEGQTSVFSQALEDSMNDLPKVIERSFEGGGGVTGAITAGGVDMGKHFGQAMKTSVGDVLPESMDNAIGGAIGSIAGGIGGSLISMGVTKLVGWISGLFGPSAAEMAGRKVEADFEQSFGGFQQMMNAVGSAYDATGRSAQEAQADVAALLNAEKAGGDAATAAANKIKQAFTEQQQDATDLTAAVQRYGFTIADLGPTMQKQQLDSQAQQLLNDWRLLVASGMDVSVVNTHMASSVQSYLNEAKATGQEVPMAMQPIIQKMIEQGDLTDANGDKITDMGQLGVSFSETMTEGFQSIVDKLDQLLTKIGMVPAAIAAIPTSIDVTANVAWNIPDMPRDDTSYAADGGYVTPYGVQYLAGGGPVRDTRSAVARTIGGPRGTDTQLAWLTPGESVLNTDATAAVGLGAIAALNRGARSGALNLGAGSSGARVAAAAAGGGESVVMQNSFDFSGSILKDRESMQELADMMATILHDKVRAVSQLSLRRQR